MRLIPRSVLGADEGQGPAGHEAERQEEDAASCVGGALKNGGEGHCVTPLRDLSHVPRTRGTVPFGFAEALFANRFPIWTVLR